MAVRGEAKFFFALALLRTDHANVSLGRRVIQVAELFDHITVPDQSLSLRAAGASIFLAIWGDNHVAFGPGHYRHTILGSQLIFHLLVHVAHIGHHDVGQKVQSAQTRFQQGLKQDSVGEVGRFGAGYHRHVAPLSLEPKDQPQGVLLIAHEKFGLPRLLRTVAFGCALGRVLALALTSFWARTFFYRALNKTPPGRWSRARRPPPGVMESWRRIFPEAGR